MKIIDKLKLVIDKIDKTKKLSTIQKILIKKYEILKKHPEYEDKIHIFNRNEVYMTSNKDIIICLELDVIKSE